MKAGAWHIGVCLALQDLGFEFLGPQNEHQKDMFMDLIQHPHLLV
jgi:hypothetical protein